MSAVVVWVWIGAVLLGLVVIGFCTYELIWKVRRLGRDVERLHQLGVTLTEVRAGLTRAQASVATIAAERRSAPRATRSSLLPSRPDL